MVRGTYPNRPTTLSSGTDNSVSRTDLTTSLLQSFFVGISANNEFMRLFILQKKVVYIFLPTIFFKQKCRLPLLK